MQQPLHWLALLTLVTARDYAAPKNRAPSQLYPPTLVAATSTSITVRWAPPLEDGAMPIMGYALHAGVAGGPLHPLHDPLTAGGVANPQQRNYTARGLWPLTQYAFKVAVENEIGRSQFSDAGVFATTSVMPMVSTAVPVAGPARGGTRVVLRGADLAFGSVYKCRFGETVVPATLTGSHRPVRAGTTRVSRWEAAPMSVHDARGANGSATIECISPASEIMTAFAERSGEPLRLSAAPFPLSVAPDGASFAPSSLAFTFYVPPVPEVHSPTSGPLAGGTSVTVTGAFPRMLFASTTDHVDASSFPEAACQFAGARVPASVLPIVDNSTAVAEELLTLNAPPPPLAPPPPFDASNSTAFPPPAIPPPESPPLNPPMAPSLVNGTSDTLSSYGAPPSAPPSAPYVEPINADLVNRTLVCVSPYVGAGALTATVLQRFSFGEEYTSVAALDEPVDATLRAASTSGTTWPRDDWAAGDDSAETAARGSMGGYAWRSNGHDDHEDEEDDDEASGTGSAFGGMAAGEQWDEPLHSADGVVDTITSRAVTEEGAPAGFVRIDGGVASASSSQPGGAHGASLAIDGSGMRTLADGRLVHGLCSGDFSLGCADECWRTDPRANADEQWLEITLGSRARHIDMIQLYGFNSPHGEDRAHSLSAADVQVPDSSVAGGWRTVGRLETVPIAPLLDDDPGVNARRTDLPAYFVPAAHRHRSHLQTYGWLGFATTAVRFANLANHHPRHYAARSFGLCHVALFEEDPMASLQLVGTAAVRARMLQLTPGAAFAARAASAEMFVPPTLGKADLDASARHMRARLRRAAGIHGPPPGPPAHPPAHPPAGQPAERERLGPATVPSSGGLSGTQTSAQCAAPTDSSEAMGGRSVLVQSAVTGLGDLAVEVSQPTGGDSSVWSGAHGQLPRTPFNHPNREATNLDAALRARLGWNGDDGTTDGGLVASLQDEEEEDDDADEAVDCEEESPSLPNTPTTWRLTAAGWLPDAADVAPATRATHARTRCRWSGGASGTQGRSRFPAHARRAAAIDDASRPLLLGAAFVPFPTGGVPLTYLSVHFDLFVGTALAHARADTGGGLWVCFSDLEPAQLAAVLAPAYDGPGASAFAGGGVCAVLRVAAGAFGGRLATIVHDGAVVARAAPISLRAHAWLPFELSVTPDGCRLVHNGVTLLDRVPLAGWAPGSHWRLAIVALTEGVPGDAYWIDNLRVSSAALRAHAPAPFEVSLNGQDFTNASFSFTYHAEPYVEAISPPDGPLSGATLVSVRGLHLAHGSDYRCLFDNVSVPATLDATSGGGRVTCTSPAAGTSDLSWLGDSGGDVAFALALNGQNYYGGEYLTFTYHGTNLVSDVLPPTGPTDGRIHLNITGARLEGGSSYKCCVVAEAQPCDPVGTSVTPARYDEADGQIVCMCPTLFNGAGAYQVRVSLNGQQFSYEPYQTLGFWALEPDGAVDPQSSLRTALVEPAAGPRLGGSAIGVSFDEIAFPPNLDNLNELFVERSDFANRGTLELGLAPRCRFGDAVVAAVRANPESFTCSSPTAAQAGATLEVRPTSADELLDALTLSGGAHPLNGTVTGALVLTGHSGANASGSAVFRRPAAGTCVLGRCEYVSPTIPLTHFELRCDLSFASLGPRDGLSLSYGDHLGHERGYGGGEGLRVSVHPHTRRVRAWLGNVDVGSGRLEPASLLATNVPTPFVVDVRCVPTPLGESGHTGVLRVSFGGVLLIDNALLPNWQPLVRADWRVGLGASTAFEGQFGTVAGMAHMVQGIELRMGAAFMRAEVPFSISYNAQDYFPPVSLPGVAPIADYMFGRPIVSSVFPLTGVALTQVQVRGALMPFTRRVVSSGGYRCLFQELVRGSYVSSPLGAAYAAWAANFDPDGSSTRGWVVAPAGQHQSVVAEFMGDDPADEYLLCDVPEAWMIAGSVDCTPGDDCAPTRHGRYALELSLHEAEWGSDGLQFTVLEPRTEPLLASPDEAPAHAAAFPTVTGLQLHAGFAYACRPQPRYEIDTGGLADTLPATYVPALRAVRCELAPPATSVSLPLVVTVQVSLDGGQYNAGGAAFTFRPIPTISAYVPAGGPVRGGAVVKVYGAHLGDSSTAPVECRFGATTVRGRRESVHDLPTLHPISLATLAPRPADATNATDGASASAADGATSGASSITCEAPQARWAGLLFGSINGRPLPDMRGVWNDTYGREVEVCTHDGGVAISLPSMHAVAVGVWDEQASAYVGMWQQWRTGATEERLFAADLSGNLEIDSRLHARGYFRWAPDYAGMSATGAQGGDTAGNATAANASSGGVASDLDALLRPATAVGRWSSHGAGRHFGSEGGWPHGDWSANRLRGLPESSMVCGWLRDVESTAAAAAATAAALPPPPPSPIPPPPPPRYNLNDTISASEIANLATALGTRPPFALLGSAHLTNGSLPLPCTPPAVPTTSSEACPPPRDAGTPAPRARQYIELTTPSIVGDTGGAIWLPHHPLATDPQCTRRLSLRLLVYAGEGSGGDGLVLAIGNFTSGELMHTLARANRSMGAREPFVLRLRRYGREPGALELWQRGARVWVAAADTAHNASLPSSLPTAAWAAVHIVLSDSYTRLHLSIDGVTHLLNFKLPYPALDPVVPPAGATSWEAAVRGTSTWRVGVGASNFEYDDRHAVADARCSCGDGGLIDVPFTVSTDGWHVVSPSVPHEVSATSSTGLAAAASTYDATLPPALTHQSFRYYHEPRLSHPVPSLGHIEGGGVVNVHGTHLDRGVDAYCGYNESMAWWTPASWSPSTRTLHCRAPAVDSARSAPLRLALNGQQLSIGALDYRFFDARVSEYTPTSGPVMGGTFLDVRGYALRVGVGDPQARCAFNGTLQAPASWIDDEDGGYLQCLTPRRVENMSVALHFAISLNGQELTADYPPFSFFYINFGGDGALAPPMIATAPPAPPGEPPSPLDLSAPPPPPAPPPLPDVPRPAGLAIRAVDRRSGPTNGGSNVIVTIWDVPMASASTPTCRFGDAIVPATLDTTALMSCPTPNMTDGGVYAIEVSLNAQDYSTGGGEFCFFNISTPTFSPSEGPDLGGTRVLTRADGLVPNGCHADAAAEPKQCKWYNPVIDRHVVVPAVVSLSRSAIMCNTPPLPAYWQVGIGLDFSVTLNGHDFIRVGTFTYERVPIMPTLSPASGPTAGGTRVTLYGQSMRNVPDLACQFGARRSEATWESNAVASCLAPDLGAVSAAVMTPPADSTGRVLDLFNEVNSISSAAYASPQISHLCSLQLSPRPSLLMPRGRYARAPTVDIAFDDAMAMQIRSELDAYSFGASVHSLRSGDVVLPDASGRPRAASALTTVPPLLRLGALTISSDVVIADNVATLRPVSAVAAATSTATSTADADAVQASAGADVDSPSGEEQRLRRMGGGSGSLLHVLVPNANAPLVTFDWHAELLFFRAAPAPPESPPSGGGGVSIEYGPDDGSGVSSVRVGRRPLDALGGTLPEHVRAAAEPRLGLNITLLATDDGLSISAQHNGTEMIPPSVAASTAAILGPPLDVWLGVEMRVDVDEVSGEASMHLSLAGVPLGGPLPLGGWQPQAGWTFRVRALGDELINTNVYRLQLLSGAMAHMMAVRVLIAVGPLFVSPTNDFVYYTPPVVPEGGVVPTSGPVGGGTAVRVTVTNYSHAIGMLPDTARDLKCRFGDADASIVLANQWSDANGTRAGVECISPAATIGAGPISLQIAANGQQFVHAGGFMYYEEPISVSATPRAGPLNGGALLSFSGVNLHSGSDYACRVGGVVVPARHRLFPERIQCVSPNATLVGPVSTPLALALNAQQFVPLSAPNASFHVYPPPEALDATPLTGPANGGTLVELIVPSGGLGRVMLPGELAGARRRRMDSDAASGAAGSGDAAGPGSGDAGSGSGDAGLGGSDAGSGSGDVGSGGSDVGSGEFGSSAGDFASAEGDAVAETVNEYLGRMRYGCAFGHVERGSSDEMLVEGVGGMVPATWVSDTRMRCVTPTAEMAGAADWLQPLGPEPQPRHAQGAAVVEGWANAANLTGVNGTCGSVLFPPRHRSSSSTRSLWFEHSMRVRARMPSPIWGAADQRVASMGGLSWSYGELPRPTSIHAVVGASGAGLGLRVLIAPREDGTMSFRVLIGGGAARVPTVVGAGLLPEAVRSAFIREEWVDVWIRHDQRGLYLNVSNAALLSATHLGGYLAARSHWSVAVGACAIAPPPRVGNSGGWHIANLTMRSGARLRYADEALSITLDGQQLYTTANLTFRYYAAARPTLVTPFAGPMRGGTPVTIAAENLADASASGLACDFLWPNSSVRLQSPAELRYVQPLTGGVNNDTDGAGGAGLVVCPTPASHLLPAAGESMLGLVVTRDGQRYSTHDDVGSVARPYAFYSSLPNHTLSSPLAGPVGGGTLVNISLPVEIATDLPRIFLSSARCRFTDWYAVGTTAASLADGDTTSLCASPTGAVGRAQLHLALNGHDFEPALSPLPFDFFAPPILLFAHPRGAPPGTHIVLVGRNLDGASLPGVSHWCRFGETVVRGVWQPESRVVDNSWFEHTVACVVPPHDGGDGSVALRVSLNGQQYTPQDVRFSIYRPVERPVHLAYAQRGPQPPPPNPPPPPSSPPETPPPDAPPHAPPPVVPLPDEDGGSGLDAGSGSASGEVGSGSGDGGGVSSGEAQAASGSGDA